MKPLEDCRLYGFVDLAYLHGRSPLDVAHALCRGGCDLIQLRGKDASVAELLHLSRELAPILRAQDVGFVVNDHPDIARAVGADFCHLGQEDFFDSGLTHATQIPACQEGVRLGLSSHAPDQARRAIAAGADYIAIGPVFATGTKPTAAPVTLDYVRWAAAQVPIPWFAIGGITLTNLDAVLAAGASRVCVVSAVLNAPDVARACQTFKMSLGSGPLSEPKVIPRP